MIERIKTFFAERKRRRMAVTIAEDVIEQIRVEAYHGSCGNYVTFPELEESMSRADISVQVQSLLEQHLKPKAYCNVCAMGSILLSGIRKYNDLAVGSCSFNISDLPLEYMTRFFSLKDLRAMECAFERSNFDWSREVLSQDEINDAVAYGQTLSVVSSQRIVQIMENVIKNKGKFVVPKRAIEDVEKRQSNS